MNNRISLYEYLTSYHSVAEKRQVFFSIFEQMHRYHNNGEYLTKLSFQTISVCFTNPSDIHFSHYERIGKVEAEEVIRLKFQNILKLSQMMICSFMDGYDYSIPLVRTSVLIHQFEQLKSFLVEDDYLYFGRILQKNEFLYYDDYIRNLGKSTFVPFQEKRNATDGEEAFTSYLLLSINVVVVLLLFSCIFLYLS